MRAGWDSMHDELWTLDRQRPYGTTRSGTRAKDGVYRWLVALSAT